VVFVGEKAVQSRLQKAALSGSGLSIFPIGGFPDMNAKQVSTGGVEVRTGFANQDRALD
jgi:hypothetical protein